jgi:Ca-activated chloride channel family protein
MVSEVNTSYFSNQGTNIGSALDNARRSFNRKGQKNSVLLLTDGENHQEAYNTFIDSLVNDDIKLIAAAIGTETGGPILEGGK